MEWIEEKECQFKGLCALVEPARQHDLCGCKKSEQINIDHSPFPVWEDELKFYDSHGNRVRPGDTITIVNHYNYPHHNGKEAIVIWDMEHGILKWQYGEVRRGKTFVTEEDFYSVHKFTRKQLE